MALRSATWGALEAGAVVFDTNPTSLAVREPLPGTALDAGREPGRTHGYLQGVREC